MARDVLITPASGIIEFKNDASVDASLQINTLGDLTLSNPGGSLTIGNPGNDVYIGDGTNSVDLIFEQSGSIRALAGKTLTLGQSDSIISFASNIGIGTSSPGAKLQVGDAGSGAPVKILIRTASADTYLQSTTTGSEVGTPNGVPLLFKTNDAERMRLDASGNLGLGVTPSAWSGLKAFQIAGSSAIGSSDSNLDINTNAYYNAGYKYIVSQEAASYVQTAGEHRWLTASSGTAGNAIIFTQAMTLDSSGNLGLGVTPSAWGAGFTALQMKSGGASLWTDGLQRFFLSSNVFYNGTNRIYQTTGAAGEYIQNAGAHQWYTAPSGTAGAAISFTQAMTLDASGNLGLGVTPSNKLEVYEAGTGGGLGGITASVQTAGGNPGYLFRSGGTNRWSISLVGSAGAESVRFYDVNNSATRMTLDASGNLGIGESVPTAPLHITNSSSVIRLQTTGAISTGAGTAYLQINSTDGDSGYIGFGGTASTLDIYNRLSGAMTFATNNIERARISSTGGFSVGTTANPGAGAIYATGNITSSYSDDRLKTRLGNIDNALEKVSSLNGFYHEANELAESLGYTKIREVGVSAQEVQRVLPEVVTIAPISDEYLTVRYERIVPLLIEAIKELQTEINSLKNELRNKV